MDLPRRQLAVVWVVGVGLLTALVVASSLTLTGGDDPDPAQQRPGVLDLGRLPVPAPDIPGIETGGKDTVVFFVGRGLTKLCRELREVPEELASVNILVVSERRQECGMFTTVPASPTTSAAAYGLPRPRDGGAPLGYAIVDDAGQIRYRTLDPAVETMLQEVATMVRAAR